MKNCNITPPEAKQCLAQCTCMSEYSWWTIKSFHGNSKLWVQIVPGGLNPRQEVGQYMARVGHNCYKQPLLSRLHHLRKRWAIFRRVPPPQTRQQAFQSLSIRDGRQTPPSLGGVEEGGKSGRSGHLLKLLLAKPVGPQHVQGMAKEDTIEEDNIQVCLRYQVSTHLTTPSTLIDPTLTAPGTHQGGGAVAHHSASPTEDEFAGHHGDESKVVGGCRRFNLLKLGCE